MATLLNSNTSTLAGNSITTNNPTANSLEIKQRKKRVPKQSKLEQLGWDTALSWSFPRFKKYIMDPQRNACSIQHIINFKTGKDCDTTGSHDGIILTFERGPRIEQLCIITKFSPNWITHPEFKKLIERFTSTSKSSRFVLISTEAKSWGKSKVAVAKEMLKTVLEPFKDQFPVTKIVSLTPVEDITKPVTPTAQKIKIVPKKAPKKQTIKKKKPPVLTINTDIEKVENVVTSPSYDSATKNSELKDFLINFNTQIDKVTNAFSGLQKSLEGLKEFGQEIDTLIGNME